MSKRGMAVASLAVAFAGGSAAAGPLFTFLAAERYVEGWANGPFMQPPQQDYQRIDAPGLLSATLDLDVFVEDDLGQSVGTHVTQASWLDAHGLTVSGQATGNSGPPAGSSEAYSHSRFFLEFQVSRNVEVPFYLDVSDNQDPNAEFHFTGPGVDLHYYPYEVPQIHVEWVFELEPGWTYTMALDVRGESWNESRALYQVQFWVPAPGAPALLLAVPCMTRRRR